MSGQWAWGTPWVENSKQETDQTLLTITKALTKTTNCTFRAKKWRGTTNNKIFWSPHFCTGPVLPNFHIRSGATKLDSKNSPIYSNACHYWILAPYFCADWSGGTNCGNTVLPLQLSLSQCVTANPIHQHVLHNTVARSHVSRTYGLRASASGCWHAHTHASKRGFLSNANLALICCIFWFVALYLLLISEVLSTFIVYKHNWRGG